MKCPTCEAAGSESRVDESGEYHNHNMYSVVTPFECSQGHWWEHHSAVRCPRCGVPIDPSGSDKFGRLT